MDKDAYKKVIRARAGLVLDHPFFGHLALQMKIVEDKKCDTSWSDGKMLAYNPQYISVLSSEKVMGMMGHVVMHPACRHHLRRNGRDPGLWNMACDHAINWILIEAGLTLPDGYMDDPAFRGKTADEIYSRLKEERSGKKTEFFTNTNEKRSSHDGDPIDLPDDADKSGKQQIQIEPNDEQGKLEKPNTNENRSEDEKQELVGDGDPGRSGEVRDAPLPEQGAGGSGEESPEESQWRINLAQAASRARSMGDLPAGLARMVKDLFNPKLDWRQLLQRFIQASARCDYAWMPPNRRYIHQGLYLPSMRSSDLPEAVVAIDTSGSVTARELDQFAAELSAILETSAQTVHLLYCDTKVNSTQTFQREDLPLALTPIGGGGTDFRPAFEWVDRQGVQPLCMIYLTDLACNRFPNEPNYPVLWVGVGEQSVNPPFGECVSMSD